MVDGQGARRWARFALVCAALAGAACSDQASNSPLRAGRARLNVAPRFALVAGGPTILLSRVDAWLIDPDVDSTFRQAQFVEGSATLQFEVAISGESHDYILDVTGFDTNGNQAYHARQTYTLKAGDNPDLPAPELTYSAADAAVASVTVAPKPMSLDVGGTATLTVTGLTATQTTVSPVNVGWTSRNTSVVTVNASGVLTGVARGQAFVVARTATDVADSVLVSVQGLGLSPDKAEKLPNGTQQFTVVAGGTSTFTWTVNGVTGGNATYGTITATGFYTAPAAVPTPSTFNVCAVRATPAATVCASVTINPVPTAGADVIVFNDMNLWDNNYGFPQGGANQGQFVVNLISFTGTGARASQNGFLFYRGHGSICASSECSASNESRMTDTLQAHGYVAISDTTSALTKPIDPTVKVFLILTPAVPFTNAEINILKQFAAEGGRIVYSGEHGGYYGSYVGPVENAFFAQMGAQLTNTSAMVNCSGFVVPQSSIRPHQVTAGLTGLAIPCASGINLGPNDYALVYDQAGTTIVGAVAKIDLTPLPESTPVRVPSSRAAATKSATGGPVSVDGVNRKRP